jgi:hypothetical protein
MWIANSGALRHTPKDRIHVFPHFDLRDSVCQIRARSFGNMNQTLASHLQLSRDDRDDSRLYMSATGDRNSICADQEHGDVLYGVLRRNVLLTDQSLSRDIRSHAKLLLEEDSKICSRVQTTDGLLQIVSL